ncbi:MAG: sprT domain-containing protein [Bacteroidota bacterium]|nr:sprT domain-containing protein [Bacteroidota bacterium]
MNQIKILKPFIPKNSIELVLKCLNKWEVVIKLSSKRHTKHGDFRILPNGIRQISINKTENIYRFLITLIHELSHMVAYEKYGPKIKPHGYYWKKTYADLIKPFLINSIFPKNLLHILFEHFKSPKASSDSDFDLSLALKEFDKSDGRKYIFELQRGSLFEIYNGRKFKLSEKKVKRYRCEELNSKKVYLFSAHAKVTPLDI